MGSSEEKSSLNGLVHGLHRASQYADDLFAEVVDDNGLTARQLVVLEIVAADDKPSQTDICARSGIDRSTIADMVRRLIKKGYLLRRRSRFDSRRYAVQLTDEGRKVLERALPHARDVETRLTSALEPKQRQQFLASLQKILASSAARGQRGKGD
ncbi:MAG: MarR family winged helix-turn-helix transcriptional regulator [Hyphomicrobium sp.]